MNKCKIEWIEIPAPNLLAAKEFYCQIFGWEISNYSSEYLLFKAGNISGGLNQNKKTSSGGIVFSITVTNIDYTLKNILKLDGEIVKEKYNIGNGLGFSANFKDPNGNILELWSQK